jgi:hypothetical protein
VCSHVLVVSQPLTITCSTNQIKNKLKATVAFYRGKISLPINAFVESDLAGRARGECALELERVERRRAPPQQPLRGWDGVWGLGSGVWASELELGLRFRVWGARLRV